MDFTTFAMVRWHHFSYPCFERINACVQIYLESFDCLLAELSGSSSKAESYRLVTCSGHLSSISHHPILFQHTENTICEHFVACDATTFRSSFSTKVTALIQKFTQQLMAMVTMSLSKGFTGIERCPLHTSFHLTPFPVQITLSEDLGNTTGPSDFL